MIDHKQKTAEPMTIGENPSVALPSEESAALASGAVAGAVGNCVLDHRARRVRQLKLALVTSFLSRTLGALIGFMVVPLFLRLLGRERYGLYESVGSLGAWLALTNVGLTLGLQNRLQDCFVSGDRTLARRYVSSLTLALAFLASAAAILWSICCVRIDWTAVFPTTDPLGTRETMSAVWLSGIFALVGVAAGVPYMIYTAYQELHVGNLWETVVKFATLAACLAAVYVRTGLLGVIVATTGITVGIRVINNVWIFGREKPWIRPSWKFFDWNLLRITFSEGSLLFLLQVGTILIFHIDKVIVSNRLGAGAVAGYAVLGRIFIVGHGLLCILQATLWPAYGEAFRRGDLSWARKTLRWAIAIGIGCILICGSTMLIWGDWIVSWVAGDGAVGISRSLTLAMTCMFLARVLAETHSVALNAAGVIKPQVVILLTNGVLNCLLALLLVGRFGVEGVAWSFPITAAMTSIWAYPWLVRKYLFSATARAAMPFNAGGPPPVQGVV